MSDNNSTSNTVSSGPCCEGDSLIVEVLGTTHSMDQSVCITDVDYSGVLSDVQAKRNEETLESSVLNLWPWSDSQEGSVALEIRTEEGEPIRVPVYDQPDVTPREIIRQRLILAPLFPLTLVKVGEPGPGTPSEQVVPARSGYLYLFRGDRLWREIRVELDESDAYQFRDVPVASYISEDSERLSADKRPPTGVPIKDIWVPVRYMNTSMTYSSDIRIAWSEVQWSAARIHYLESDRGALRDRAQRIVQQPAYRWNPGFAELMELENVVPLRSRQPAIEEQLPCAYKFLSGVGSNYGLQCYELAREEQQAFLNGGEDAEEAWRESQYRNTNLGPFAAIRNAALEDFIQESREDNSEPLNREVWDAVGEGSDALADARERGVLGVVVYDELYELRAGMARANAGIQFQNNIRDWASEQPHYQSAELVEQSILPETLGGQPNPLSKHAEHLDLSLSGKLERALHRAYRAQAINAIKEAQRRLLALVQDSHNQTRLADLFSLEGGDYLSGFVLTGELFSALQHDPEAADKPWLAGTNPDCDIRCNGRLTDPDDSPALEGSQLLLDIAGEGSDQPLHAMLYPKKESVPLDQSYELPEPETNPGDGRFRPADFAKLDLDDQLPGQEDLQTLEAASMVALTEQGAFNSLSSLRQITKALDGISSQLMSQFNRALQRIHGQMIRIDLDIHGPMVRALKAMNPTLLGELQFLPQGSKPMHMVVLGVEDPELGLRNGLTEAERDYFNSNNRSGRFLGEIQDSEGRIIGNTNPNRVPGGVDLEDSGRFYAFMAPANSDLVKNYREVREEISRKRSLGKTLDRLGLPYVVLGFELWNVNSVTTKYQELTRVRGEGRARAEYVSAVLDLMFASISVAEQLSKQLTSITFITRQMNRVIFDIEKAVAAGRISQAFGSRLPRTVTLRMASVSILAMLDAGIRAADSIHYLRTGQIASAAAMGSSTAGALMTGWASLSLMSPGAAASSGGAVLGLSTPAGWIILGIGLTLVIGGSVAASLLEDDELESWLKNGPFGDYRSPSYEHLWGDAPETDGPPEDEVPEPESTGGAWSWLPWADNTPAKPAPKPVPEREAFYRLANILAGLRIEESLHRVDSSEAHRLAEAHLSDRDSSPSRREVDALQGELIRTNFRVVVRSNLASVLGDTSLKVYIRRYMEERRPNPPSGGTTVARSEVQESPTEYWWIYRRALPDGVEYWLHTPKPEGMVYHEWKVRARMVAGLGTDREYVFPAPPVSSSLVYQSSEHGKHDAPDFTRDDAPFWASLTTNRVALNVRAYRQRKTAEEAADG